MFVVFKILAIITILLFQTITYAADDFDLVSLMPAISAYKQQSPHNLKSYKQGSVTSPSSGVTWMTGSSQNVMWSTAAIAGTTVSLYVLHDDPTGIDDASPDTSVVDGKNWYKFAENKPNNGLFTVDPGDLNGTGNAYKILVVSNTGNWGLSAGRFSLSNGLGLVTYQPRQISSPANGDVWQKGTTCTVTWQAANLSGSTVSMYILQSDATGLVDEAMDPNIVTQKSWNRFANGVTNTGSYSLSPTGISNTGNAFKILLVSNTGNWDVSSGLFSLTAAESSYNLVTFKYHAVTSPAGGEVWSSGVNETIDWDNTAILGGTVDIYVLWDSPMDIMTDTPDPALVNAKRWHKFASGVANSGSYVFNPAAMSGSGNAYKVLLVSSTGDWGISSGLFTLQ